MNANNINGTTPAPMPAPPPAAYNRHPLRNRHQVLKKYTTALLKLRKIAEQTYNVSPFYFDNYVLFQYFQERYRSSVGGNGIGNASDVGDPATGFSLSLTFLKVELLKHILDRRRQVLCYLALAFVCLFVYRYEAVTPLSVKERSMHFVYPSMRMWRRITLPLLKRFPRLTELYDEPCLMENPFFQLEELSCEPCALVESVVELSQTENGELSEQEGSAAAKKASASAMPSEFVPFMFKINQEAIRLDDFYNIYTSNHKIFQRDAYRVQSTNHDVTNLEELFNQFNHSQHYQHQKHRQQRTRHKSPWSSEAHNMWRCNRMLPARLLRQLIPRPGAPHLPTTGIALERYMAIDTPQAPSYTLPDTECANVFVQQACGTRYIILRPTSECRHRCRTLSIRLPSSAVLSYNLWYWKPISAPDPLSDTLSISLIGSYC